MQEYMKRRNNNNNDGNMNFQLAQLALSLIILGALLISRAFFPEKTQVFLNQHINDGLNATEVLSTIGEGFMGLFSGAQPPKPLEESQKETQEETQEETQKESENKDSFEATEEANNPEPLSYVDKGGIGGFDEPILYQEFFLPTDEYDDEIDDTFPIPFGMEKPEKVDYGIYELPFETALPVSGIVSSPFGYRTHPIDGGDLTFHYGTDIAANSGTTISAFADGTVVATGSSPTYGLYIMVKHDEEYLTFYAHCSKITVKEGAKVKKGGAIAKIGSTGKATGPHVHFELRKNNSLLNPEYYLDLV